VYKRQGSYHSIEEIITFITKLKSEFDLEIRRIPLKGVKDWIFDTDTIHHVEDKYFRVIATDVEIGSREVVNWSQPMVEPAQQGIYAFVCKEINGIIHFIVQAKLECGNHDILELAPTVQCMTGNYRHTREGTLPVLDYVLKAGKEQIFFDTRQSEEGGRFFHEQNRNLIVIDKSNEIPLELPPNYIWMTLNQLYTFLKFNNYLNIQARSLIAAISLI
jgi:oxidase EvaA